eukprot:TRINITY_DN2361_c1_g2_i5.p1 TRINITY_DN2361_c1_g2~~TRINITY_DN2361_c1_g2_i5.p1  ORF type:complete len:326 (+),score=129.02 TRINITY_DN2361_c1_g2_i5:204-1181(+)
MDHYKIYNMCAERAYDADNFYDRVERYPFEDHNAPQFEIIEPFCQSAQDWLDADEKNIVVVHCKAGKGRAGTMISALMVHIGRFDDPEESLNFFGRQRTSNGKGVTIPSQRRFVHYYGDYLKNGMPRPQTLKLCQFRLYGLPKSLKKKFEPVFTVQMRGKKKTYSGFGTAKLNSEGYFEMDCTELKVKDIFKDFKICVLHSKKKKKKQFHFWLHSYWIKDNRIVLTKTEIDKINKDKKNKSFDKDFKIELIFETTDDELSGVSSRGQSSSSSSSSGKGKSTVKDDVESDNDEVQVEEEIVQMEESQEEDEEDEDDEEEYVSEDDE